MTPARARAATSAAFALNGFALGMWVVNIPEIRDRTDTSTVALGYLLLLLGGSALVGMQLAGRLIDAVGSRLVLVVSAALLSVALVGPAIATSTAGLAVALGLLGFVNGGVDVSQNAQGVEVERSYGRPIFTAFHAFWSLGGLVAAGLGGGLIALGVDVRIALAGAGALCLALVAVAAGHLLPPSNRALATSPAAEPRSRPPWTFRVALLAVLAFTLLLAEGVAYDWSTVHLHDSLDASKTVAAWAFGAFSIAMTAVRLVADRFVDRLGAAAYVQRSALVGAVGLAGVMVSPSPAFAIAAWTVFGLGISGCVPQFFNAAGNVDPGSAGIYLARVAGVGYLGLLAGPAVIGLLTHWTDLTTAFVVPMAGCLAAALLAPQALRKEAA